MVQSSDPLPTSTESRAWQNARQYGIDMSLLESNLRKTVWERMVAHDRAVTSALVLREAMQQRHG